MNTFERNKDPKKIMKIGQSSKPVDILKKFHEIPKKYKPQTQTQSTGERQIVFMIDGKRFSRLDKQNEYGYAITNRLPVAGTRILLWHTGKYSMDTLSMDLEWDTNMDEAIKELRHQALTKIKDLIRDDHIRTK